jgi:hypothetical protein
LSVSADLAEIRKILQRFNGFRECVIQELIWKEQQFALDVLLTYIWTDDGRVSYTVGARPKLACIRFSLVQEIHFRNQLRDAMISHADKLNWGTSEIAKLEVDGDSESLLPYRNLARPFFHAQFVWEWGRMIEVVFGDISVKLKQAP